MNNLLSTLTDIIFSPDMIFSIIIIVFAIIGLVKGFCNQLFDFVGTLVALILACCLAKTFLNILLENTDWATGIANSLYGSISSLLGSVGKISSGDITSAANNLPLPASIRQSVIDYAASMGGSSVNFAQVVSNVVAEYILLFICFIVLFIALKILVFVLRKLFGFLTELPVVYHVNKILGLILGLFKAYLIISIICIIFNLLQISAFEGLREALANSVIVGIIDKINIVDWLLSLLKI